ncbi:hypothetical protein QSG27_28190 [Azospirillum sp. C340-1]|uniref:Uncharacterized protein n=2 Tax=Azospirillum isscasi TaxID=3053926 RepID=A0ABU0WQY9_9PROT|nr:hypothetical protein [Azospirillum isscasi]
MATERVLEVVGEGPGAVVADVSWCERGGLDLLAFVGAERAAGRTDAEIEVLVPSRWGWLSDAEIIGDTVYVYASCVPAVL